MGEYIDNNPPKFYCEKCGKELNLSTSGGSIVRECPEHLTEYKKNT